MGWHFPSRNGSATAGQARGQGSGRREAFATAQAPPGNKKNTIQGIAKEGDGALVVD